MKFGPKRRIAADANPNQLTVADADARELTDLRGIVAALDRSQARIEFEVDGTILRANENFLKTLGYRAQDVERKHHRMFVDPAYAKSPAYAKFWDELASGTFQSSEFQRFGRNNKEVWIRATYNPVVDADGKVTKVIKFASDITQKKKAAIDAVNRTQATIEFTPDGTIVTANANFSAAMGYSLDEIRGKHHRMFCEPDWVNSEDYEAFWTALGNGQFQQGQYQRVAAEGREVLLQATYNPEFDERGNVEKVVKYATDITAEIAAREQTASVAKFIAHNMREMDQAISEITRNVTRTAGISTQADTDAQQAAEIVERLNSNSDSIDSVVSMIRDLAEQTNLLALNATIEAARAGDMGKGFAVVASEIKTLASETAKATESIGASVRKIHDDIAAAVASIDGIATGVSEVNQSTSIVAAAVEEQSVLMQGMSTRADELLESTQ